jgi:hypothetical protein
MNAINNIDLHRDRTIWDEPRATDPLRIDLIILEIGEVYFGVLMSKVDRVVDTINTDEDFSFLEHVEVLDLHYHLFGTHQPNPKAWAIVKDLGSAVYGIPVDTIPTLVSIPLDLVRILPADFRATSPLGIASHIARTEDTAEALTVFAIGENLSIDRLQLT